MGALLWANWERRRGGWDSSCRRWLAAVRRRNLAEWEARKRKIEVREIVWRFSWRRPTARRSTAEWLSSGERTRRRWTSERCQSLIRTCSECRRSMLWMLLPSASKNLRNQVWFDFRKCIFGGKIEKFYLICSFFRTGDPRLRIVFPKVTNDCNFSLNVQ